MNNHDVRNDRDGISGLTADFVCFVCGAIFTTDEDRKVHLEKEAHGKLHDDLTEEERQKALEQEKLNEERIHRI
jgi:hypothetical protein